MKFAVIDTETTGLFDFKQPSDAEGQPRMAQFGMLLVDDLEAEPVSFGHYIKPDGWEMPEAAGRVNGLTTEFLCENGIPVCHVLDAYVQAVEEDRAIVAFNAQFDLRVMRAELRRAGRDDLFERTRNICVMRPLTPILQLPKRNGAGFKFPNLSEACAHFGIVNERAHDAIGDAMAALEILRHLVANDLLPDARIHYARNREAFENAVP